MTAPASLVKVLLLATACLLMHGCGSGSSVDVQQWIAEQKLNVQPLATQITEPKKFSPAPYVPQGDLDPFNKEKLVRSLRQEAASSPQAQLINPELARRKEALEAFPLDSMEMVGSMSRAGKPVALIKIQNTLYSVRPGQYLGPNFGRVTRITPSEVVLRELVEEGAGEWVERMVSLQIQERSP